MTKKQYSSLLFYTLLTGGILATTAVILYMMGRIPICKCGYIKFWHGETHSSENSQHLTDFYTFSHILHGFIFYWVLTKMTKRMSIANRFMIALLVEVGWEILENSPFIIDRYRTATISLDYYGDSIVNSMADIVAMGIGFWIAARVPVWVSISLLVFMEVGLLILIRDNLTLNIIMLLHPFEFIKNWQAGG